MELGRFSMGIGDRFGKQGRAQLQALISARVEGIEVTPVWNKSHREHTTIGTQPGDVRTEADAAVSAMGWGAEYRVDADHIGLGNVDLFMEASDFFTLDVAEAIGGAVDADDVAAFVSRYSRYVGALAIPGINRPFEITETLIREVATTYLGAVREAGRIYRRIEGAKGVGSFITEVSMDETAAPQTPVEMFFILAAIADEGIPAQTIAPKFSGRFNKGVDYVGDLPPFTREFEQDLAVIRFGVAEFGLPANLKLSVHSGSDKFSLYGPMGEAVKRYDAGLHLKTAGTTWLEELIGLASAGGDGLALAREVYRTALGRFDELCGPYATVIDIDPDHLPTADAVDQWTGDDYADALRHDQACPAFNPDFRQLLHVGYKVAAEMGGRYLDALDACEASVAANVTRNILDRHLRPLFGPAS
jgi:hypothetical protein